MTFEEWQKKVLDEKKRWAANALRNRLHRLSRSPACLWKYYIRLQISRGTERISRISACPGEYPFTRGVQATMYRGNLWSFRQYAGYATPEESNQRYKFLLDNGQTGLSVAMDLPTQLGLDSDDPRFCRTKSAALVLR